MAAFSIVKGRGEVIRKGKRNIVVPSKVCMVHPMDARVSIYISNGHHLAGGVIVLVWRLHLYYLEPHS